MPKLYPTINMNSLCLIGIRFHYTPLMIIPKIVITFPSTHNLKFSNYFIEALIGECGFEKFNETQSAR